MAEIIPLRPITSALAQLKRMGRPELRADVVRSVVQHLRAGDDGFAVARGLQAQRFAANRISVPGGAA